MKAKKEIPNLQMSQSWIRENIYKEGKEKDIADASH